MKRWLVIALVGACADPNPLVATPHGAAMPPPIVAACDLARTRCSRCHTIDRVLNARITTAVEWRSYVHRMRLMPGSAILADEEPQIASCFIYRATGQVP